MPTGGVRLRTVSMDRYISILVDRSRGRLTRSQTTRSIRSSCMRLKKAHSLYFFQTGGP